MDDSLLRKDFIACLDECLESINADGSIKSCEIDWKNKEVIFKFDLVKCEQEYLFFGY